MTKGQAVPFDTAVVVQINTYRLESQKMEQADTLVASQRALITHLQGAVATASELNATNNRIVSEQAALLAAKLQHQQTLEEQVAALRKIAAKKTPWYADPKLWGTAGLVIGILLTR